MLDMPRKALASTIALHNVSAWLEGQPAEDRYVYSDPDCALAQYLASRGFTDIAVESGQIQTPFGEVEIPPEVDFVLSKTPHTFGAAAARARAQV